MSQKRDTVVYELIDGDEVVYIGTTNNPDRREQEHRDDGKIFDVLVEKPGLKTEDEAKKKETEFLNQYFRDYQNYPKYNKDSDG